MRSQKQPKWMPWQMIPAFLILHRLTDVLNGSITGVGIAGTIGDKQSVELQPVEIIVPGNADDFHPPSQQTADDVSLHTAIHKDNLL